MIAHSGGKVSIKEPVRKWTLHFDPWLKTGAANLLMRPSKNSVHQPKGVQYDPILVQKISELKAFKEE